LTVRVQIHAMTVASFSPFGESSQSLYFTPPPDFHKSTLF